MKKTSAITLEARSLLILGLPLVGSQVAQFAVHTTDTLMLGWYSVLALAQVTLGAQVLFIAFIATSGFAFAISYNSLSYCLGIALSELLDIGTG